MKMQVGSKRRFACRLEHDSSQAFVEAQPMSMIFTDTFGWFHLVMCDQTLAAEWDESSQHGRQVPQIVFDCNGKTLMTSGSIAKQLLYTRQGQAMQNRKFRCAKLHRSPVVMTQQLVQTWTDERTMTNLSKHVSGCLVRDADVILPLESAPARLRFGLN